MQVSYAAHSEQLGIVSAHSEIRTMFDHVLLGAFCINIKSENVEDKHLMNYSSYVHLNLQLHINGYNFTYTLRLNAHKIYKLLSSSYHGVCVLN